MAASSSDWDETGFKMAASSSDWDEAVAYWSGVGELGMEAALRGAGCSEQSIVDTLSEVKSSEDIFPGVFLLSKLNSLTTPESARAVVLATIGRDISRNKHVFSSREDVRAMTVNEAAALCVNLCSNTNITDLILDNMKVFGTVKGCGLLAHALATNSSLRALSLKRVDMGSAGVRCLLHGLKSNKTLERLDLSSNPLLDEGISCVAEFLINNATIEGLVIVYTNMSLEGAKQMSSALASNSTLRVLFVGVEAIGREGMKMLLQPLSPDMGQDEPNANSPQNTSLEHLYLYDPNRECVESVTHMIKTNKSLRTLGLQTTDKGKTCLAPFLPTDWKETIIPALKANSTLTNLDLFGCYGVIGEDVYESLLDLLQNSDTGLETIILGQTGLESKQGQINEELRINKEYRSRLKGQPQTPVTSGRIVLCGYGFAGKTEISKTMQRIEIGTSYTHPVKMLWKGLMQSYPSLQRILLGSDAHKELTARTRGFQVVVLEKQPYLKSIWDFAGQKEYYALHDYVFPDVKNSVFLYICSCRDPPGDADPKGKIKHESAIRGECEYWMRFLASNSKQHGGTQLPRVRFVLTKTDTLQSPGQFTPRAKRVVRKLKNVFKDVLDLSDEVEVVNAHSAGDVQRLLTASSSNLKEILAQQTEYVVCEQVRDLLQGWSKKNPLKPVLNLEEYYELCRKDLVEFDKLSEEGWKIVLAYLNDLGEIIFSKKTDFIVTNPSWFGIDVLGSLINAFKGTDQPQLDASTCFCAFSTGTEFCELDHCQGFVERQDMTEHLQRSLQSMDLKQCIPPEKLIDLMIHLEMCFQNTQEDRKETCSSFFMPALFDDEKETAARGKRQLDWKLQQDGHLEYFGRRLECQNRSTTFLTPGFFPRLQVHLRNYLHKNGWTNNPGFGVGRNLIQFTKSGIEVCMEYAGDIDDSIDILVRSSEPFTKAMGFVQKHVVEKIRTFCASPQGCQGVELVESVIRPVCVEELHLCIKRKEHSVLVAVLKGLLAEDKGYQHTWSQRIEGLSGTDRAFDLLEGKGSYEKMSSKCQGSPVPLVPSSTASVSSSTDQSIPTLVDGNLEPGDLWQSQSKHEDGEEQWVMGFSIQHLKTEMTRAPRSLWHTFRAQLEHSPEFNNGDVPDHDFVAGKDSMTFTVDYMNVRIDVKAEKDSVTFDEISVLVNPQTRKDEFDTNQRKQCQVNLAEDLVNKLLDLWKKECGGVQYVQKVVWPWPVTQSRPVYKQDRNVEVAEVKKWVQMHGMGRKMQWLVGRRSEITEDQLLSTEDKNDVIVAANNDLNVLRQVMQEAVNLGIYPPELTEELDVSIHGNKVEEAALGLDGIEMANPATTPAAKTMHRLSTVDRHLRSILEKLDKIMTNQDKIFKQVREGFAEVERMLREGFAEVLKEQKMVFRKLQDTERFLKEDKDRTCPNLIYLGKRDSGLRATLKEALSPTVNVRLQFACEAMYNSYTPHQVKDQLGLVVSNLKPALKTLVPWLKVSLTVLLIAAKIATNVVAPGAGLLLPEFQHLQQGKSLLDGIVWATEYSMPELNRLMTEGMGLDPGVPLNPRHVYGKSRAAITSLIGTLTAEDYEEKLKLRKVRLAYNDGSLHGVVWICKDCHRKFRQSNLVSDL